MKEMVRITPRDMVAVALQPLKAGETVSYGDGEITLKDDLPMGHKAALRDIRKGEAIIKYGFPIGEATEDIPKGGHVHTHNLHTLLKGEMARDSVRAESQLLMVKLAEANAVRSKQIETVCQYVSQYLGRYPIIVCGDFNDNPISFSRHRMGKMLTDCFVESGRGVGLSYNQKAFSFRIDHIFCSADITPYQCEVDTKMDASDHFPMVCWLKIGVK